MKMFAAVLGGALVTFATSAAWADDPASLFIVRDPGYGSVGLTLSAEQQTQTDSVTFGKRLQMVATDNYKYKSQDATISGSIGVGYGFEFFLDVPDSLKHQTVRNGVDDNLATGFADADFGFKYRLFGSEKSPDHLVLRATFTHHNSSVGTDQLAFYYAHLFSPEVSLGLETFYEYEEIAAASGGHYRADQYGGSALLFWNVAPRVSLIPFARIYNTDSYETVPSDVTSQAGLQLCYFLSRSWSLTPTASYLHTGGGRQAVNSIVSINYGVRAGGLATLLLQYQF